jgi:outer membrane protein assembly factor BamB
MKYLKDLALYALLTVIFISSPSASSQTTAQWRGLHRDGIYEGMKLARTWPQTGPQLLWFTEEIGNGYGAPAITADRIYVNGETDSTSYLFAFDKQGKLLWKSANGKEFTGKEFSARFPGSRSVPTIVGNLAYACSGNGRITCVETSTGTEKWAVDMMKDLGGIQIEFGYSESLLVDGDKVFCFPGGPNVNAAAYNRFNGKQLWTSKALGDTTTYCSPMLISLPARKLLVNYSRRDLFALDAATGDLLWSYPIPGSTGDAQHSNTPIFADGFLYLVSGEEKGKGAVKLALSADGKSVSEVWTNKQVRNAMGGFVVAEGKLFTTTDKNVLKSVQLTDGVVTDTVKIRNGSLLYSGGVLVCYGNNGEVNLVTTVQGKLAVTGKFKVEKGSKDHFAHPVLADGVLYIRRGKGLMAYKVD